MSKYKKDDKVVIRKDLKVGEWYGDLYWANAKEYMKEKNYVVIEEVDKDGSYWVEGYWIITDEMIEGLYEEEKYSDLNEINNVKINIDYEPNLVFAGGDLLENTVKEVLHNSIYKTKNEELSKKVLLRNGTTVECKAKDLLVVDDMKGVKDNIKKYPNSVVILSSEILVIK